MPRTQLDPIVRHLYRLAAADRTAERTDAELLRHFVEEREEAAFQALLQRHGGLVMGVCRRLLPRHHDAEDAFQATFLALVRHAPSIRRTQAVASWLYRVAHRIATKAGTNMARRSARERQSVQAAQAPAASELALRELQAVVDEEVRRLPEKYRAAFVLCCLEGKTRAEAARELGWKEGTVAGRLAEARQRLQQRLARRGVVLSVALTVMALARGAEAALPPAVLDAAQKAALQYAAGARTGGAISASVAALVQGATRTMWTSQMKTVTALLLMLGLLTAGALTHRALAAKEPGSPAAAASQGEDEKPPPAAKAEDQKPMADVAEQVEVKGRVLGPDGKPFRGAEVLLNVPSWTEESAKAGRSVRATSDAGGRFQFRARRSEFERWTTLVAVAPGYGPALASVDKVPQTEQSLKLVEEVPITGRIIDLEGRPIKGAAVKVEKVQAAPEEDLTPAFKAWQQSADRGTAVLSKYLGRPGWAGIPEEVTTDADGRFRITGVGRERLAVLKLEGETIEHKTLHVLCRPGVDVAALTRPDPEKRMPGIPRAAQPAVYGPTFEHAVQPCKPIAGVVRDRVTGKPVAGASISGSAANRWWGDYAQTKTDAEGRFRLVGVAKASDYTVSAYAGDPYLPSQQHVGDSEGLKPLTVNFDVVRGVLVKGRITDKETGKPVFCALWYFPLADNKFFKDLPGKDWYSHVSQGHRTDKDGSFSLTALPGSGVIKVRAENEAMGLYTEAVLDSAHRSRAYGDDGEGGLGQSFLSAGGSIETLTGHHAYRLIEPPQGGDTVTCDIELDRGKKVTGTVVDPDGKPLAGAKALGLTALGGGAVSLKDGSFTAQALNPARPRTVAFVHKERKLAGHVALRGNEREPVTVKLEPWGTVTGRALDEEGRPLADAEFHVSYHANSIRWLFEVERPTARTDRDGRFRVEGLFPGVSFAIGFVKRGTIHDAGDDYRKLSAKPGQTNDIGDVKTKIYRID
jgi:RNA polymerase sigma factor (sigma-70 family)